MNGLIIFIVSLLVLFLGYVIYGGWMSQKLGMNPRRKTPARKREADGAYGCTTAPVAAGAQFASLGGLWMIQGTIVAMRFGWLPALLCLLIGGVFLGGVLVYGAFFASMAQNGQTMGIMVRDRLGKRSGKWFQLLSWICIVAIIAVLLEATAGQLAGILPSEGESVVQNFQGGALSMILLLFYPISILFGLLNRLKCPVVITTLIGIILLGAGICAGLLVPFYLKKEIWLAILMTAGVLTAVLPVWLVTQPKNYLGSILAVFLLVAAGIGICFESPQMSVPAFAEWYVDEQGVFPWLIVALGGCVISGYQGIQAAVFGARQVNNERNAKAVGYAPVLLQCLFGVLALVIVGSLTVSEAEGYATPLEAFTGALVGVLEKLFPGEVSGILLEIGIGLVVIALMAAALESAIRAGSLVLGELAGRTNTLVCSIVTVGAAFGVRYVDLQKLTVEFGIYLMLLGVPICFSVMVWQKQSGRSSRLLGLSLAGAGGGVLFTAGYFLVENIKIVFDKGVSRETVWEFAEIFFLAMALIILMIFMMDGVRGYMKKRRIIFATGNAGKMREIREILGDLDAEILSLKEAGIEAEIEENGSTFEENAIIKAKAICEMTGCLVLADDSGLEIDYLNKEPGVLSARYMGEDTPYTIKNNKLIERLEGVPEKERTARFVCVIAAAFPDGKIQTTRGTMEGYIGYEEKGENGFGYDPIFFLKEYGCSSAELSMEEKNKISHRGKALRAMKEKLI